MGQLAVIVVSLVLLDGSTLALLPTDFNVTGYDLSLSVSTPKTTAAPTSTPLTADVTGKVVISLTCLTTTASSISLHWGTTLRPASPTKGNFTVVLLPNTAASEPTTVEVQSAVTTGDVVVLQFASNAFKQGDKVNVTTNTFSISINNNQSGMFFYPYANQDLTSSYVIVTNLKPNNARNVFPCLDEPRHPAIFNLTLARPSGWSTISSLPLDKSTTDTATSVTTDVFTSTTRQPLSAFSLVMMPQLKRSDYSSPQSPTGLHFWAPRGYTATALSPDMAALASYYYQVENLVGSVHPAASGLRIVLLPDLAQPLAGYSIICVRFDSYSQNWILPQKEGLFRVTMVPVVRQFIRQFTEFSTNPPDTWADAWVTEATTRYLSYALLNTMVPPFDLAADLEVVDRQTALFLDSSSASPLDSASFSVDSPAAAQLALTDPLRLAKATFVLSMLDMSYPSGVVFNTIKTFFQPTTPPTPFKGSAFYAALQANVKLWESGEQVTNLPLWFTKPGYPQLNVSVQSEGSPGSAGFYMMPFCKVPPCSALEAWWVAATLGSRSDPRYYSPRLVTWLTDSGSWQSTNITLAAGDWLVANMRSSGYYRAQYTSDNWQRIGAALNRSEVPGRSQLLDDAFALSAAGRLDYNTSLGLALALATSRDALYRDWYAVYRGLQNVRDMLTGLPQAATFQSFANTLVQGVNTVVQNASTDAWQKARVTGLFQDWMCEHDVAGWRSLAVATLPSMLQGKLPSTMASSSYDAAVCCGSQYTQTHVPQQYWANIAGSPSVVNIGYFGRRFNAIAIGCTPNYQTGIVPLVFDYLVTADPQLNPHIVTIFQYLAEKHPFNLVQNLTTYALRVQNQVGAPALADIITSAARKLNTDTAAQLLQQISGQSVLDGTVQAAALSAANAVTATASWLSQNSATLEASLRANTPAAPSAAPGPAAPLLPLLAALLVALSHLL